MADPSSKQPQSVEGKWYVDTQCIDCDLCRQTAPENFTRNEDDGFTYLHMQPATPEQEEACEQAAGECPVEAIGNDG